MARSCSYYFNVAKRPTTRTRISPRDTEGMEHDLGIDLVLRVANTVSADFLDAAGGWATHRSVH